MLHSFYRTRFVVEFDGVPTVIWIRWYRAPAGAKQLAWPVAFKSSVWDNDHERYDGSVGELRFPRIWDRGLNPGYKGQSYIGDPTWFQTGDLPGSLLTDPIPPVPSTCCTPPATMTGGIILGGTAAAGPALPAQGTGGVVLGGGAVSGAALPAKLAGGMVLGGGAVSGAALPAKLAGGVVLGGMGRASMSTGPAPGPSSYGFDEVMGCDQFPDGAAAEWTFAITTAAGGGGCDCSALNRQWTLLYGGACVWASAVFDFCGDASALWSLLVTASTVSLTAGGGGSVLYSAPRAGWSGLGPITLGFVSSSPCTGLPPTLTLSPA